MVNSRIHLQHVKFALAFLVLPCLTFLLSKLLYEMLAVNLLALNLDMLGFSTDITEVTKLNEIVARLLWVASVMVYFFVTIGFGFFVWKCLWEINNKIIVLVFFMIALLISSIELAYVLIVEAEESRIASIFYFTFNGLQDSGLFSELQLSAIYVTLNIINFIGFIVVPFGMIAGCSIMFDITGQTDTDPEYFLQRLERLKKLITGGSAVMVIGVIHMQLWLSWPLSIMPVTELTVIMKSVILTVCQYWGVCYSLIIAAVYLPAASYLSQQAKMSIETGQYEQYSDQWLKDNKMVYSLQSSLPQIIAVMAPMLAGTFGSSVPELAVF